MKQSNILKRGKVLVKKNMHFTLTDWKRNFSNSAKIYKHLLKTLKRKRKKKNLNEYEQVRDAGEDVLILLQLEMEEK